MARRLQAEGVAMFFAIRDDDGAPSPLDDLEATRVEGLATQEAMVLLNRSARVRWTPRLLTGSSMRHRVALSHWWRCHESCPPMSSPDLLCCLSPFRWVADSKRSFCAGSAHYRIETQALMVIIAADASGDEGAIRRAAASLDLPLIAAAEAGCRR